MRWATIFRKDKVNKAPLRKLSSLVQIGEEILDRYALMTS